MKTKSKESKMKPKFNIGNRFLSKSERLRLTKKKRYKNKIEEKKREWRAIEREREKRRRGEKEKYRMKRGVRGLGFEK